MATFTVAIQKPAAVTPLTPGDYDLEMEALGPIDAEIVEIDATTDAEFIAGAKNADAIFARGRRMTKEIIDGLENCKVISLGSVGADSVDIVAATARGIYGDQRAGHLY